MFTYEKATSVTDSHATRIILSIRVEDRPRCFAAVYASEASFNSNFHSRTALSSRSSRLQSRMTSLDKKTFLLVV